MTIDLDALVLGPGMAVFGESVTYAVAGGTPVPFTLADAVFDSAWKQVTFGDDGAPVSTEHPILGVRLSLFPAGVAPAKWDQVTVRGQLYNITDVNEDSHGHAKLILMIAE